MANTSPAAGTADPGAREAQPASLRDAQPASLRDAQPVSAAMLVRVFRYVRPYLGLLALALVASGVVSVGRYARVYILKPVIDDIALPAHAAQARGEALDWIPDLGIGGLASEPQAPGAVDGEGASGPPPERPPGTGLSEQQRQELAARLQTGLRNIVLAALLIVLVAPLAQFAQTYLVEYVLGRTFVDIKRDICGKLLALPLRFHRDSRRGDTLSRIMNDVQMSQGVLDLVFGDFLMALAMLVIGVALLFAISWQLTLSAMLAAPIIVGIYAIFGKRIRKTSRRRQEQVGEVTQKLIAILSGIKVIKAFRAEDHENEAFARENEKLFRRSMKVVKNRVLAKSLVEAINMAMTMGMVIVGTMLLLRGLFGLTPGDVVAFAGVLATVYKPTKTLSRGYAKLLEGSSSAERFFAVLDAPVELEDVPDPVKPTTLERGIRFEHVSFSYGREPVLRDVSLEIGAGEVVAVVGRTGAGKTTIVDLLLRFDDPTEGVITFDGVDLRRIERSALLDLTAVVTQEPFLFEGTIRDNIGYAARDVDDARVLRAARAAHVDEFVDQLPLGYDTEVGDLGVKLSGGQRQRITIARAVLKDPAILIFDEATSSLDAKSERIVQEAIEALREDRTVLVISHRLSTIRNADRIVVLEDGTVSEVGTHDELMARGGLYRELVALQTDNAG